MRFRAGLFGFAVALAMLSTPTASAAVAGGRTHLVSVSSQGVQGNDFSASPVVSANGRYVAFVSAASNLVPSDTNGAGDVFVRDLWRGRTSRVSVSSTGAQANSDSFDVAISATGRYVAFASSASNLVPGRPNGLDTVYVRDLRTGTTSLISLATNGAHAQPFTLSRHPSISADGRYVVFYSDAANLVPGDTNGADDVFVRDRLKGTTRRLSVSSKGAQARGSSLEPVISANGRYVAYYSDAANLVPGPSNGLWGVFVRDLQEGTTSRVSISSTGALGWGAQPAISATGRYVAFAGSMPGDGVGVNNVYVRDRELGTTARVSVAKAGGQENGSSNFATVSPDGRFVGFVSDASNLVPGDTNATTDVFVRDLGDRSTSRVNVSSSGAQAILENTSGPPSISSGGRIVAFSSAASNLVPGDTNGTGDIFVRAAS
jgi:Tol biopolymer transport system component